jgi:hypothetical protein
MTKETPLTVADRLPQAGDVLRTNPALGTPLRIFVQEVTEDGLAFGYATRPWSDRVVVECVILDPEQMASDRGTIYLSRADGGPVTQGGGTGT